MEISTSQNVYLNQEKAGIGERFLAFIIDAAILIGFLIATSFLASGTSILKYIMILNGIMFLAYPFIFELYMNGQTFGKLITNIRVVDVSGEKAGFYQYLIRNLLRPVDYVLGLGLIFMIFNKKGQRIGDLSGGTFVIKHSHEADYLDTVFVEVEENYTPVLMRYQIEKLNAQHIELIKTVLEDSEKKLRFEMVGVLYQKVCDILQVEQKELTHFVFLETVIKDFNYYQQ